MLKLQISSVWIVELKKTLECIGRKIILKNGTCPKVWLTLGMIMAFPKLLHFFSIDCKFEADCQMDQPKQSTRKKTNNFWIDNDSFQYCRITEGSCIGVNEQIIYKTSISLTKIFSACFRDQIKPSNFYIFFLVFNNEINITTD